MSLADEQVLEAEKLKKKNKLLHDFLNENNIGALVSIWEKNENVRDKFNNQKSLQKQYPEYARILIDKANKVKKEIFLHNHKPLINASSIYYNRYDIKEMTFDDMKRFFDSHRNDFREKLGNGGITLSNFIDFEDVNEKHIPQLKVLAFVEIDEPCLRPPSTSLTEVTIIQPSQHQSLAITR
ncbi:hypothetical protein wNo_10600 [Wolbachia endosymbiont of Drosophila simulans wNo]|uniref:hypothetical protein n=1 Tax=unclassified Wolbachia TaxID=2640676 RepID=UPI0002D2509B|nr:MULTISPECIES: hypothetical protein [unclassified Wolbachia]AGJ99429.1 hypothetical protein wNo_10600 [Wolbachia endosymbiont of Drosophila simulans wNo]QCB62620.1 hypothetical protein EJA99_03210 [Wolbachia endosymbiont of Drosophila mauritiana]QCB63665.1 hypothetical protein EJB00_03200 [Wolbachia endosymbiont of Drosophila mauritiana]QWE33056.1 Uncharacterized protein WwMa_01160 [Wolbachia endosymbiont of Drosophila simulans]TGB06957.1 hypothetical protein E5C28_02280 [Wolbachia endosymbi